MTRHCAAQMDSPHGRDAVPARAVLIDAPLTPVTFSGASGCPAFAGDPPVADTGSEAAVRRLAFSIVISDAGIQPLVTDLFRVRIPTAMAHSLNCYLWLGPDGVTVVDTGRADSAPVIACALELPGRRTSDVERIVLSHFRDDHVGSAATVAQWSPSTVVAGRADTPFIRGAEPGPWPVLTAAEQALNPPMPGTVAPPHHAALITKPQTD